LTRRILSFPSTTKSWNRPKVGPFEIRIRYQTVEEPPVRVLVVEDDPLVRELVVEALREEGYEVIHAANREQALAWCKRRIADVLVTDIKLPGQVDGWQIAELCREHDPGLPVIYATDFSPVEARPVPGSLTLQKPCSPDRIVKAVRQMGQERRPSSS
jgi:DNA-binding NtrC family response regulator